MRRLLSQVRNRNDLKKGRKGSLHSRKPAKAEFSFIEKVLSCFRDFSSTGKVGDRVRSTGSEEFLFFSVIRIRFIKLSPLSLSRKCSGCLLTKKKGFPL